MGKYYSLKIVGGSHMSETTGSQKIPTLFTVTGPPGTGKSTAAGIIEQVAGVAGLKCVFIGDYDLLLEWGEMHIDDPERVRGTFPTADGGRIPDINPAAYPEMSL